MQEWWSRRIMLFMLSSFLCSLVSLATARAATEEKHLERTFRGTINEKWEIQLTLRSTEPISGSYYYERVKKPILLEARLDEDQNWIVTELDDKRTVTGQFVGDIFGRVFSGTWSNADKSKSYPFRLIETHRQRLGEKSPYRSTDQLFAQAKKGKRDAQFHVALLYHYGQGGLQHDMGEAVRWYKKAATQGHPRAQFNLGGLFLSGHGVKRNSVEALRLIGQAAKAGDQGAKEWLADFSKNRWKQLQYEKRSSTIDEQYVVDLIEADPFEAEMGLKALDSSAAKVYLAYMYYEGKATVSNPSEVVNGLLREASSSYKKDLGEVTDTFFASGRVTLFNYMREMAGDVIVPCEIFVRYPREALEAFQPHYGGCRDVFPSVCGDALLRSSVPTLNMFLSELWKFGRECDIGTIRCAIGKGQAVNDTLWNMAPQMFVGKEVREECAGVCDEGSTRYDRLRWKSLRGLEKFFRDDLFFTEENARNLAYGYIQEQESQKSGWDDFYNECPEESK